MNSVESDLLRAICSKGFLGGFLLELFILLKNDVTSGLFCMSIPLICTLPYSCGYLNECKSGFIKFALSRSSFTGYICGKFFAAGAAGGLVEVLGVWASSMIKGQKAPINDALLFFSAFLWASVATTLASVSGSKYLAYGGAFVVDYFLVLLHERYFGALYCLNSYEWVFPLHPWIFDETGIKLLVAGLIAITALAYYTAVRRRLLYG